VSSYAIDDGNRLLLFDPLAPPANFENARGHTDLAALERALS
jgi:hypothetical protein